MRNKERILSQIKNVKSYIDGSEIEVAQSFTQQLLVIEEDINNFRLYLPLIGGFNAGKSTLINAYLNSDELLPTNIIPETAVATELYFSPQEKIEVYKFDNQTPIQVVNSLNFADVDRDLADYLKVYINSPQLQKHNIIFVDMPGLDSNLQRHNQSILNYMTKDVSFVLVLNIEDGTIKNSTLEFLKEIKDYRLDFVTILNKIDKKLPNEVAEIKKHIEQQASSIIQSPFVGTVSAIDNQIDDFKSIIENIDVDEFIQKLFDYKAKDAVNSIIFDLKTRRDTISLDVSEIDKKISDLLSSMRDINKEFESEKRKVENKFSQTLLVDLLRDVENRLRLNIHSLMEAIEVSNEHLNTKINDLIRPLIASKIKNYSETIFAETIKNIEIKSNDIFASATSTVDIADKSLLVGKAILPLLPSNSNPTSNLQIKNRIK
ncbi:MAG: hypothetical protein KU38_09215 [Sulfurovum sp. FS08-3]|nr:MAG: hypothetical protein KU38_09215 [Sulfurovum sp. FS08-3]